MPIQIIDNFDLNVAKPIDNRFVVGSQSFYTTKEQIPWKYAGMRIWDLNDSTPYVWTGTTYSSENSVSITGVGTINPNYIAKFGSVSQITSSNIYDDGSNIGIGNASPTYKLHVSGQVYAATGFVGDGSSITSINATNISSGYLSLNRIQLTPGNSGYILTHNGTEAIWTATSSISVENSTQAAKLSTSKNIFGQPFNGTADVTGNIVFGTQPNKATLTYATNVARTLTVPALGGPRTFAFLEQAQTFTGANVFNGTSTFNAPATFNILSGNNYTFFTATSTNNVGIFFQNGSTGRSLYMDSSGNLITGGSHPYNAGFNNFRLSSSGLSLGSFSNPGTTIRKMIVGTIIVNYTNNNVGDHTILYGSGFTLEYHSHVSTGSYGAVYVKITGGIVGNPVVVVSIAETGVLGMSPASVTTLNEISNNRFLVQVGGVGSSGEASIQVSFSYFEV